MERVHHQHQGIYHEDGQEYVHRGGILDPPDEHVYDESDQAYVQYVGEGQAEESEKVEKHRGLSLL